jgi:hypothetical protein
VSRPALLAVAAFAAAPFSARGHTLLDPGQVQQALVDIARAQRQAHEPSGDPEALYALGEKVELLVDLLNQDAAAHGGSDILARLVVDRLRLYDVRVDFPEPPGRYAYDLAAFREYLARAPEGKRAPAAWFRLLSRAFHDSVGADPSRLAAADAGKVAGAAAEEERFLKKYPADEKAREVRFFLAVDYYRLARAERPGSERYQRLCRAALESLLARYPSTMEARTAAALLETLAQE